MENKNNCNKNYRSYIEEESFNKLMFIIIGVVIFVLIINGFSFCIINQVE